jgi:replication factor C subunit 2/4
MSTADTKPAAVDDSGDKKCKAKGAYEMPWVERYRPITLDDVVGNEETLVRLKAIAEDGNMPNLILCGPPGTGKTTSMHALARQLLGSSYTSGVLELNASDARGIDVSQEVTLRHVAKRSLLYRLPDTSLLS